MKSPILADEKSCTGCFVCVDSCKREALLGYVNSEGHFQVKLNADRCVKCFACEKVCPVISAYEYSESEQTKSFAAWNINETQRQNSASGGAFSAIANYILLNNGVVYGSSIEGLNVKHVRITSVDELVKLQGSKYSQSDCSGIYNSVLLDLFNGNNVLFSGTGCQVAALLSFIKGKKYTGKLTTVDIICGGVPSKLLIDKFAQNQQYQVKRIVSFRSKETGWKPVGFRYNLKVEDVNGVIHDYTGKKDLINHGFASGMTTRYSCYNCKYVGLKRQSDYTIGDLWGDSQFPEQHRLGLSALVAHNQEAIEMLYRMGDYISVTPIDANHIISNNKRLIKGRKHREFFIERRHLARLFDKLSYKTITKIYASDFSDDSVWMIYKVFNRLVAKTFDKIFENE